MRNNKNKLYKEIFSVDFDESLGKNDPYLNKYYEKLTQAISTNNMKLLKRASPIAKELFHVCKNSYLKYQSSEPILKQDRIPRIFHQIWVGKNPFPEKYKAWKKTWEKVPGWEYKFWTDEDVEKFEFANKDRYYQEKNMGVRADILRVEILYQFGGVYVDADFELINPKYLDVLNDAFDFYASVSPIDFENFGIINAIIGAAPKHPIIKGCLDELVNYSVTPKTSKAMKNIPKMEALEEFGNQIMEKGPRLLTQMFYRYGNKSYRDLILPPSFFCPLAILQLDEKIFTDIPESPEKLKFVKEAVCKPETIALHWFENSWIAPTAWE